MFTCGFFLIFYGSYKSKLIHLENLGMGTVAISVAFVKILSDLRAGISRWAPLYLLPFCLLRTPAHFLLRVISKEVCEASCAGLPRHSSSVEYLFLIACFGRPYRSVGYPCD